MEDGTGGTLLADRVAVSRARGGNPAAGDRALFASTLPLCLVIADIDAGSLRADPDDIVGSALGGRTAGRSDARPVRCAARTVLIATAWSLAGEQRGPAAPPGLRRQRTRNV